MLVVKVDRVDGFEIHPGCVSDKLGMQGAEFWFEW